MFRVLCGCYEHQRKDCGELAGIAEKFLRATAREVGDEGPKIVNRGRMRTEKGREGESKVIASCSYLEANFQRCSKKGGVALANSVETLGVDLTTRTKQLGAKGKAGRRMCDLRFSNARRNRVFQKNYMKFGARKLLRMGLVPARVWGRQAVVILRTEKLKLSPQMAAAAGKKE